MPGYGIPVMGSRERNSNVVNRTLTGFKLVVFVVFFWFTPTIASKPVFVLSDPATFDPSRPDIPQGQRTHELVVKINGATIRLVLSTGLLGFMVIVLLALLLAVTVLLAIVARRKARHLGAANRQLKTEISERNRSEEELRRATEMVCAVAETAPLSISAIDLEGRVTFWNPASAHLFGWAADEVIGQPLPAIPTDNLQEFRERLQLYKQKRAFKSLEVKYLRKDDTCFDASLWTAPLTGSQGQVVGMLGITADITERKQAIEQLRVSELRFRQLADSMPQIVWTACQDGSVEYLNERWYKFTGYAPSDHLTEDVHSIIHSEDLPVFLTRWRSAVRAEKAYEAECRLADHHTGGYRWFLCRAVPARDSGPKSIRWFGTFTDIHEQKRIEAAFRRANEDLNRFAYSTNHDLQEPLRNVSNYSQLLEKRFSGYLDTEAARFVRFIARDARRMCALITNLSVYTSAGNRSELIRTSSDANVALDKALLNLQAMVSESQAVVVHTDLPRLRVAEKDLQQVFQNLIQNAIQYRKSGVAPRIDITAERRATEWTFSIQDNGIGIPAEYTQQIFGIFRRLHGAGLYGSIGMGLAICQKIIEHHGGSIWAESQLELGSIFRFSLPAAAVIETIPKEHGSETSFDIEKIAE
jgi:PAS domain S-box-containing protein